MANESLTKQAEPTKMTNSKSVCIAEEKKNTQQLKTDPFHPPLYAITKNKTVIRVLNLKGPFQLHCYEMYGAYHQNKLTGYKKNSQLILH